MHLLILDSVSTPQIIRQWPKTMHMLRELDAVHFRYVNKVGQNSNPNLRAMLLGMRAGWMPLMRMTLGRQTYSVPATTRRPAIPPDVSDAEICRRAIDSEPFIGFEFRKRGYKTMISEDWFTLFDWPNCVGFQRTPADHSFL